MIHIRKCIRCGNNYDIGTNYNVCPECRRKDLLFLRDGKRMGMSCGGLEIIKQMKGGKKNEKI